MVQLSAQEKILETNQFYNVADQLLQSDGKLMIGGYGEVHYNQALSGEVRNNGVLDVHRVVLLFGYNFNEKTQFITEVEYEHVSEVYIEQAFIQHKINPYLNFRGGLVLIPMGIVNEYHEPTTFNGVERPTIDSKIAPSTWREIGFGFTGNILEASLKYQAYLVNGFNGFDGSAKLNGNGGLRSGRQKGAESYISAPNFTAKAEFYGIRGLNLGLSGYFGNTQSKLYHKASKTDAAALAKADSSVVGIAMLGLDGRYNHKALQLRGQLYYTSLSNTDQYNRFTAKDGKLNDLGSAMFGYYVEAGYNVLRFVPETEYELVPFVRLEAYNTHLGVDAGTNINPAYQNNLVTTGLTLKLAQGVV
ncbi:MAG: hypothetical protein JXR22_09300, partial [Prolixibacteraceae bacterium]|nr:hypothetical protein [Prolixibacteraceae bacterium]